MGTLPRVRAPTRAGAQTIEREPSTRNRWEAALTPFRRRDSELEREERNASLLRISTFGDCCQRRPPGCGEHAAEHRGCRSRVGTEHLSEPVLFRSGRRVTQDAEEALVDGEVEPDEQCGRHRRG